MKGKIKLSEMEIYTIDMVAEHRESCLQNYKRLSRIELIKNNKAWIDHVQSIGVNGPQKSMVISTEETLLKKQSGTLVIDQKLAKQLQFIKEGKFVEKDGAKTLKLIGDVVSVDAVEVERTVEENVFGKYPYSAMEVWKRVKEKVPNTKQNELWSQISENGLKGDERYSKYNFRNLAQESEYKKTARCPV